MTLSYNSIVSRIQQTLNSLTKDTYIPRRYILSVFKAKAESFMAQKFHDKSLFRETSLYEWIDCVCMEEVPPRKCGVELKKCDTVMRSKHELPGMIWSRYGPSLITVTTIDGDKDYEIISHSYYSDIRNSPNFDKFKGNYAIVYPDNRLYIPDNTVRKVNVLIYSLDEKKNTLSECGSADNSVDCTNYWDTTIELSSKLSEAIFQETLREISMRLGIPFDADENNNPNPTINVR